IAERIDGWQAVPRRKRENQLAMSCGNRAGQHNQAATRRPCKALDSTADLGGVLRGGSRELQLELGCVLHELQKPLRERILLMIKHRSASAAGRKLLKQFQPFDRDCKFVLREAGGVAAGAR